MNPKARQTGLVVEEFRDEVLIYDTRRNTAHSLNPLAAKVWRACDGNRSPRDIAAWLILPEDEVTDGLARLDEAHLFETRALQPARRKFMRKVGAAAGLLLIASISAPRAAHAKSPGGFERGNNGVGNGVDPQPPGNPPINDGTGTSPGNPGNRGGVGFTEHRFGKNGGREIGKTESRKDKTRAREVG